MDNKLRIMTNNCWNRDKNSDAWAAIGEDCSADVRSVGLSRLYLTYIPDIICFQEMTPYMMGLLRSKMSAAGVNYELIAREPKDFTSILYNPGVLELIDSGSHLFDYGNDARSKGYTWGYFRHIPTGSKFVAVSTHWWWKNEAKEPGSDEKRRMQAAEIVAFTDETIEKYGCPVFVQGDFNTKTDSPSYREMIAGGFEDCQKLAASADNTSGYHYCFPDGFKEGLRPGTYDTSSIDHMMVKKLGNIRIDEFRQPVHDYYWRLSDHIPAYIDISLAEACK